MQTPSSYIATSSEDGLSIVASSLLRECIQQAAIEYKRTRWGEGDQVAL